MLLPINRRCCLRRAIIILITYSFLRSHVIYHCIVNYTFIFDLFRAICVASDECKIIHAELNFLDVYDQELFFFFF